MNNIVTFTKHHLSKAHSPPWGAQNKGPLENSIAVLFHLELNIQETKGSTDTDLLQYLFWFLYTRHIMELFYRIKSTL